ncbi:hypothetical protein DRQ20_04155 [bacterium]|nr:MAG: hypothetical protein DRQ20_04155 [bacterium]
MKAVLIHGFSGTPEEMEEIKKAIPEWNPVSPLLPGHGGAEDELLSAHAEDWMRTVEEVVEPGDAVIGFSLGSFLGIIASLKVPLSGLAMLSPPVFLRDKRVSLSFLARIFKKVPVDIQGKKIPAGAVYEFLRVRKLALPMLEKVEVPVFIVISEDDPMVEPESAEYVWERIGSRRKRILRVKDAGHMLVYHPEVVREVGEWLREIKS